MKLCQVCVKLSKIELKICIYSGKRWDKLWVYTYSFGDCQDICSFWLMVNFIMIMYWVVEVLEPWCGQNYTILKNYKMGGSSLSHVIFSLLDSLRLFHFMLTNIKLYSERWLRSVVSLYCVETGIKVFAEFQETKKIVFCE